MARHGTASAILLGFLVVKAAQWTTSSSPLGTAFVSRPPRQHDLSHNIQRRSLSDAQRAVLRLPGADTTKETGNTDKAGTGRTDAGRRLTDAERTALRLPDAEEDAELIDESEYRQYFEKVLLYYVAVGTYLTIWAYTGHMF